MSTNRPLGLPDFRKPPLVEVALSLQFEPVGVTASHMGLLWQRFRDRLSRIEEHAPLEPVFESFGPPGPPGVKIALGNKPPVPRVWFLNERKTELVQVQTDRFIHNWRKIGEQEEYPRYETIRDQFRDEVRLFAGFLNEEGLGGLSINQCEVTYVNHVEVDDAGLGQAEHLAANWRPLEDAAFLPPPEDLSIAWRFRMPNAGGRLHVLLQPASDSSGKRLWAFRLMARGRPTKESLDDAFAFLDQGREWIVRGFTDLTTSFMHRQWEKR